MSSPKLAGIDPSLKGTAVATSWGVLTTIGVGQLRGPARLDKIERAVIGLVAGAQVVVIEGYAFDAPTHGGSDEFRAKRGTAGSMSTGELGGVLRLALWRCGIPYVEIAPSKLKVFATGSGKGDKKGGVLSEAVRRLGYAGSSHDEADALWLLEIGLHAYGHPDRAPLPPLHLRALQPSRGQEPIPWPNLNRSG